MRSRIARVGVLVVGVLALVASTTPPAVAHTDADIDFVARATLNAGIGAVGTDLGLGAPTATVVTDLELQDDPVPQGHVEWGGADNPAHNRRSVSLSSTTCTITGVQGLNKQPPKNPGPFTHNCTFAAGQNPNGKPNYVQGYCGLSGGQLYVTLTDDLGQVYDFDIHYSNDGVLTITGHWRKRNNPSQHGKIVGEAAAAPEPGTGSCTNKTATQFLVVGTATMVQSVMLLPPLP